MSSNSFSVGRFYRYLVRIYSFNNKVGFKKTKTKNFSFDLQLTLEVMPGRCTSKTLIRLIFFVMSFRPFNV